MKLDTDLPYGLTAITFRFPGADNPDFAAAQILSDVLSSQRGKLYGLVPQGRALFAEFGYDTLPKSGLGYAMAGFPTGADSTNFWNKCGIFWLAEITNGVTADLVEAAKRREIMNAELQKNSVQGLASAWSEAVAVEDRQSPDDDINPSARSLSRMSTASRKPIWILTTRFPRFSRPHAIGQTDFVKKFWRWRIACFHKKRKCETAVWARKITEQLPVPDDDTQSIRHEFAQWPQTHRPT
jgi:hypothetical protein